MDGATTGPDWVMVGGPLPDGSVRIIASKELSEVELRTRVEHTVYRKGIGPVAEQHFLMTCDMGSYLMVHAPTYADAFQHLFTQWSPDPGQQPKPRPIEAMREIHGRYGIETPPELLPE
jgi:hypothetical protein